jgi:hypothetical protein
MIKADTNREAAVSLSAEDLVVTWRFTPAG